MKKIASFTVDHRFIKPGIYVSRIDDDITTYDLRTRKPNSNDFMDDSTMHTFEHLFATFARNTTLSDQVIYVGPMGCRTGFYLLLRDSVSKEDALALVQASVDFISGYVGDIPGGKKEECGNFREHDLDGAKAIGADMKTVIAKWTVEKMTYPE